MKHPRWGTRQRYAGYAFPVNGFVATCPLYAPAGRKKDLIMARRYTPENFRTPEELAAVTGRSARTARRWLQANPHIGVRIGGRRYVHADEVEQILVGTPLDQIR